MGNLLIEVHSLETMMPSLMNRGENNEAKTINIGGTKRARISSQSIKYALTSNVNGKRDFIATKHIDILLKNKLDNDNSIDDQKKEQIRKIIDDVFSISTKDNKIFLDAITRLTEAEIECIYRAFINCEYDNIKIELVAQNIKDTFVKDAESRRMEESLAIWGRFTAKGKTNIGETNYSAIKMAHAFSIDEFSDDRDFFTAIDSVKQDADETGAGMLDSFDLEGNVMYKYMNISPVIAYENMKYGILKNGLSDEDKNKLADAIINTFCKYCTVHPVAKQNSCASFNEPSITYISIGNVAPLTMGARFQKPLYPKKNKSVVEQGIEKFLDFIKDDAYSLEDDGYKYRLAIISSEHDEYKELFEKAGVKILNIKEVNVILKDVLIKEFNRLQEE